MFDRFTDRARKVMGLARQESQRFHHDHIGPEHMLLGILKEGSGVAVDVIKNLDIDPRKIRDAVEKLVSVGNTMVTMGQIPFTPEAKRVLELALEEAGSLGHNYIGTEHLLLGLVRQPDGIAAKALHDAQVHLENVRAEILELLGDSEVRNRVADSGGSPVEDFRAWKAIMNARIEALEARVRNLEERA